MLRPGPINFSQEEINSMKKVLEMFEHLTSEKITKRSHKEKAWKDTKNKEMIGYECAKSITWI